MSDVQQVVSSNKTTDNIAIPFCDWPLHLHVAFWQGQLILIDLNLNSIKDLVLKCPFTFPI